MESSYLLMHVMRSAAITFVSCAMALGGACCASLNRGEAGSNNTPSIWSLQRDTAESRRTADTIVILNIDVTTIDSLYVLLSDADAQLRSVHVITAEEHISYGEVVAFQRTSGADANRRAYGLFSAKGMVAFGRPAAARVDVTIVIDGDTSGAVELGINRRSPTFGGPQMTSVEEIRSGGDMTCERTWAIAIRTGCSVNMKVFPAGQRRAVPVRTTNVGAPHRDTTVIVGWNCLRDDGARADTGVYRVQFTPACQTEKGTSVIVRTVHVRPL